ncbi:hypothetical protein K4L44_04780 [Halosquirtibacter laminarini]|uniref:Uncharacterized protein n=1 Tax=Halosquirtibacter laminarini TaxID=3374600 RepID=A0AC61NKI6_9BACT|nr:hypothetical protein K4L44_04780 [Prolixibacteraceae bacterium]
MNKTISTLSILLSLTVSIHAQPISKENKKQIEHLKKVALEINEFSFYLGTQGVHQIKERGEEKSKKVVQLNQDDLATKIAYNYRGYKTTKTYSYHFPNNHTLEVHETYNAPKESQAFLHKIYFNHRQELIGFEILQNDKVILQGKEFRYKNNRLVSYKRGGGKIGFDTVLLTYNKDNQTIKKTKNIRINERDVTSITLFKYNHLGFLTDLIFTNDFVTPGEQKTEKHLKYSDFDVHGDWQKAEWIHNNSASLSAKRKLK